MMKRIYVCLLLQLVAAVAFAQTHQPAFTVQGRSLKVEADLAWIDTSAAIPQGELVTGTPLASPWTAAESEPGAGIEWQLEPGQYQLTALGRPDDYANPQRSRQTFAITIEAPGRIDAIRDTLNRLTLHRYELYRAIQEYAVLNPTAEELLQALEGH